MNSQVASNSFYCGQMLWARCTSYPYWPAIVCPSETGEIQDTEQYVHVSLCADNGRKCWVKAENVFEFNGNLSSYLKKKVSLETQLSKDDFNVAFGAKNNDAWRKAVLEGTFIFIKNLDKRLAYFDILKIQSLREYCTNPTSLTDMIFEHCTRTQRAIIESIVTGNFKFCEDIEQELNNISAIIDFDGIFLDPQPVANLEPVENSDLVDNSEPVENSDLGDNSDLLDNSEPVDNSESVEHSHPVEKPIIASNQTNKSVRKTRRSSHHRLVRQSVVGISEDFHKNLRKYIMTSYPKNTLFRGIRQGNICKICISVNDKNYDDLIKCSGVCGDYVHRKCVYGLNSSFVDISEEKPQPKRNSRRNSIKVHVATDLLCNECNTKSRICYVCKEGNTVQLNQCNVKSCGRYYHTKCLDNWSQTKFATSNEVVCPLHFCHTCVAEDPERNAETSALSKLTRCIKCLSSFHIDSCCIPAGTKILTSNQLICIRHRSESRNHASLDWCFDCGEEGGVLLSCGSCPKTFHMSCLNSSNVQHPFLCATCEIGKNPLYGDIVCAFSADSWWPAIIVPPFHIPKSMYEERNNYNIEHDFCVQFFGTHDFGWLERNSVYPYAKDYEEKLLIVEPKLEKAVTEVGKWLDELSELSNNNDIVKEKPPAYVKITTMSPVAPAKISKDIDLLPDPCSCTPWDNDPCGPTSSCKNRECNIECGSKNCPSGSNCRNQSITQKKFANVQVAFMGVKGFGLIANENISAGSLVHEYVGELVTQNEYQRRKSQKQSEHYYYMKYSRDLYIDAEFKGNESRFINHSCNHNSETEKWTVNGVDRIVYVALTDIAKGTEITSNYAFDLPQCYCDEENCSGGNIGNSFSDTLN